MNATASSANADHQADVLKPPPDAYWFALFKQTKHGGWERCARADWGARSNYWEVSELAPELVALEGFGPGIYHVMWRGKDRRKNYGRSKAFDVQAKNGNGASTPVQPEVPSAQNFAPQPSALGGLAPLLGHDPSGPLAQFLLLYQLVRDDAERSHQRMMSQFALASEQERARTELTIAHLQAHYNQMTAGHLQLAHQIERAQQREEHARQLPLAQHLETLTARLAERGESDEDDDDGNAQQLVVAGGEQDDRVLRIMEQFSAPIGQVVAQILKNKLVPDNVPQPDAAE